MNKVRNCVTGLAVFMFLAPDVGLAKINKTHVVGCVLEPKEEVNISAEQPGKLNQVNFKKGDYVKKGSIVARIDPAFEHARLKTASLKLQYVKRKLHRYQEMITHDLVSKQEVDDIKTEIRITSSEINEIKVAIANKTIRSPIGGYVTEKYLSTGEFAAASPILKVMDTSGLNANIILHKDSYKDVKQGDVIKLSVENSNNVYPVATIKSIDKKVNPASETFSIEAYFSNHKLRLPSGLECNVR